MAKYGVGIVGAGWVAGEHINSFRSNPLTEVRGIASRTKEGAEQKAKEMNLTAKVYDSIDALIESDDIDIISICSPPNVHVDQIIKGAEAGKAMVIEKPIGMSWEDTKRAREAVEKAGVKTVVGFVLRWNPLFTIIKDLIGDHAIGNPFYAECDYWHWVGPHYGQYKWSHTKEAGGSSLLSAGCHAVDAIRWFTGEVSEVQGYSTPGFAGSDYEFDPNIVASLKFADGGIGKVSSLLECQTPYVFNINLLGDQGSIRNNKLFSLTKLPGQTDYAEIPTILPDSGDVTHHPFQAQIDHFIECIEKDEESHCNIADASKSLEVCFAIDLSIETGKPVSLPLP